MRFRLVVEGPTPRTAIGPGDVAQIVGDLRARGLIIEADRFVVELIVDEITADSPTDE